MNPASSPKQTSDFFSRLVTSSRAATLALIALFVLTTAPATLAGIPESELKRAGAIALDAELLEKMEKFFTTVRSDAAAKAKLATVTKENKDNPPMTGEGWGSLITTKCPKAVEIFEDLELNPEEFGKAVFAMQAIILADAMKAPGDKDSLAKSENKTVAANAAFVAAHRSRAEAIVGNFSILGL